MQSAALSASLTSYEEAEKRIAARLPSGRLRWPRSPHSAGLERKGWSSGRAVVLCDQRRLCHPPRSSRRCDVMISCADDFIVRQTRDGVFQDLDLRPGQGGVEEVVFALVRALREFAGSQGLKVRDVSAQLFPPRG